VSRLVEVPPLPLTRSRGRLAVLLPLPFAVALGLAAGLAPRLTLVVLVLGVASAVLLVRLEWAALAVIGTSVFADYVDRLAPHPTEWLVLLLLLAWVVRRAAQPRRPAPRAPALLVPAGLLAAVLVGSLALNGAGPADLETAGRYAATLVAAVVLADCLTGPLAPRTAAAAYVLTCSAAALCALVTAVVTDDHRVAGPLADPDQLALYLVVALPMVGAVRRLPRQRGWATHERGPSGWDAWPAWACGVVLVVALLGTESLAGYLALGVVLLAASANGLLSTRYTAAALGLVATGIALVFAVLPRPVGDALAEPEAHGGLEQQLDGWAAAARSTAESPLLGHGPGAFARHHDTPADSTPLEVAADLGVLGAAALYAAVLVPALPRPGRVRRRRRGLRAAVPVALAGAVTASLLVGAQLLLPLWLLAAFSVALRAPTRVEALS
jgi:putative inorganic carbon (hco3(-)) transporter